MILRKNKNLQSENATLRIANEDLTSKLNDVSADRDKLQEESERKQALVSQMEIHLEKLQSIQPDNPESSGTVDLLKDAFIDGKSSEGGSLDLMPIVQAQRDRFKKRKEELEEENALLTQRVGMVTSEVSTLRSDNVKLYEKIQFLRGFKRTTINVGEEDVDIKYRETYENKLDPFTSFSRQERQRKVENLNVIEKIILWMVRFVLGNKIARIIVFVYAIFLHIMVFVVLMWMAVSESRARQVAEAMEWRDKYNQHMIEHHH